MSTENNKAKTAKQSKSQPEAKSEAKPETTSRASEFKVRPPIELLTALSFIRGYGKKFIEQELEDNGIQGFVVSHGSILAALYFNGSLPMQDLAKIIGRRKSTVTVLVRKLIKSGYVCETEGKTDKRFKIIELTAKGEDCKDLFNKIGDDLNTRLWAGFNLAEQEKLMEILAKIENNIRNNKY